jgi:hypothetical protein
MRRDNRKARLISILVAWIASVIGALACDASSSAITTQPLYICPSSTPRPTDTPLPPDPPVYPFAFAANVDYTTVQPGADTVTVQYMAQSAAVVMVSYYGYFTDGTLWRGLSGWPVAYPTIGQPGISNGRYPVYIPTNVFFAVITLTEGRFGQSYTLSIVRYPSPVRGAPTPPPCCLPLPIYPTSRPINTPYPTPTTFQLANDYYLGDPVYTYGNPPRIRLRLTSVSPQSMGADAIAFVWRFEIKNIGMSEYAFVPFLQTYVSEIRRGDGSSSVGVWGPSLALAQTLGINTPITPLAIPSGAVGEFAFVTGGFRVRDSVEKVSFVLDPTTRGTDVPTVVPGSNIVRFRNQINPVCRGEITEPT